MSNLRDPARYRRQAARFRELAAAATDSRELRDSYLALSLAYERLARILADLPQPRVAEEDEPSVSTGQVAKARSQG